MGEKVKKLSGLFFDLEKREEETKDESEKECYCDPSDFLFCFAPCKLVGILINIDFDLS